MQSCFFFLKKGNFIDFKKSKSKNIQSQTPPMCLSKKILDYPLQESRCRHKRPLESCSLVVFLLIKRYTNKMEDSRTHDHFQGTSTQYTLTAGQLRQLILLQILHYAEQHIMHTSYMNLSNTTLISVRKRSLSKHRQILLSESIHVNRPSWMKKSSCRAEPACSSSHRCGRPASFLLPLGEHNGRRNLKL